MESVSEGEKQVKMQKRARIFATAMVCAVYFSRVSTFLVNIASHVTCYPLNDARNSRAPLHAGLPSKLAMLNTLHGSYVSISIVAPNGM
jgi:hypothetical protein